MTKTVISAWSAVSPFGIGREAFVSGFHAGRSAVTAVDREQWRTPDDEVCLVPGFSPAAALGRKGTRAMDRVTGLAVSAVGRLIDESPDPHTASDGEDVALVLGTTSGSVQSMMDFTRSGLVSEKPYFVDPARFPNAVMNCAAGQCAIRHRLKGPNTTIAAWPRLRTARAEVRAAAAQRRPGAHRAVRGGRGVRGRARLAGPAQQGRGRDRRRARRGLCDAACRAGGGRDGRRPRHRGGRRGRRVRRGRRRGGGARPLCAPRPGPRRCGSRPMCGPSRRVVRRALSERPNRRCWTSTSTRRR